MGAYSLIAPLYDSVNASNDLRLSMAAIYGCYAGINVFNNLGNLVAFGDVAGSGFWEFLAQEFPSTTTPTDDKIPQSASYGIDAIQATLHPGVVTIPAYMINTDTYNPASLLYTDRTNEANSYLTYLSMALMGSLENRYGLPTENNHKSTDLPWTTATATAGDGCAFVSALLNYYDGIQFLASASSGTIAATYTSLKDFLSSALATGCSAGCALCGGSVSCTDCPVTLRSRDSCLGTTTDVNSCAAAGIVTFVNSSWSGPP